jgi:hypothetical protein
MLNRLGRAATINPDGTITKHSPENFEFLADLFTHEAVVRFEELSSINEAQFLKDDDKLEKIDIAKQVLSELTGKPVVVFKDVKFLYQQVSAVLKNPKGEAREAAKKALLDSIETKKEIYGLLSNKMLSDASKTFAVLDYYLYYKELAKAYRLLNTVTRQDTSMPKDYKAIIIQQRRLKRLLDMEVFLAEDINNLIDNSYLKAFKNAQDTAPKLFKQFFTATFSDDLFYILC